MKSDDVTDPHDVIDMIVLKIWKWKNRFQQNDDDDPTENDKSIFRLFHRATVTFSTSSTTSAHRLQVDFNCTLLYTIINVKKLKISTVQK